MMVGEQVARVEQIRLLAYNFRILILKILELQLRGPCKIISIFLLPDILYTPTAWVLIIGENSDLNG